MPEFLVMRGLDPRNHADAPVFLRLSHTARRAAWIAGSSPATTRGVVGGAMPENPRLPIHSPETTVR
jgi:hypothetical protein